MKLEILFFVFVTTICKAQNQHPIQTDRPDQTECPFIVPTNYFQFENGFSYEKTNTDLSEIVIPTVLIKFGINDHFELRFISEYVVKSDIEKKNSFINPILIGFKTRLFEEKGLIPLTSFIGHISIPKAASIVYKKQFAAPEFRFTMQHTITESQTISYNIGAEWNGETAEPTYIYTFTSGYSMSDKTSVYIEFYGFIPNEEQSNHRFDGGFCYLLNSNHQFDISAGFGLTQTAPNYFFALGYSFRFMF
jgi:hypothetical protein